MIKAAAQETAYFDFSPPSKDISYSVFNHIEFSDTRLNKDHVGLKQKGGGNHLVPIWLHSSLTSEMETLIDSVINDVPQQPQTILLNFRSFFISEYTGRFEFHVECYAKWEDGYWLVYRLDSVYKIAAKDMAKKVNKIVGNFISTIVHLDLSKNQKGKAFSLDYIRNIDMNEKRHYRYLTKRTLKEAFILLMVSLKITLPA
jgi:hypothetical protein